MNILITSAGRRSYMVNYFKQALNGEGLVHASNSEWSPALQVADKALITPLIYDPSYIDCLLNYAINNKISVIISLFDIDLPILAKNKTLFDQNGIKVIVSDHNIVEICNDKWKTYNFLQSIGIPTPNTCLSIDECKQKIKDNGLHYPLIIKPRWGMGSIGIYKADNYSELELLYKKTQRDILNSYLKYESYINQKKSVIIQQNLIGDEYGLDVFNDLHGNFLTCIPKRKISMRSGETDSAEIIKNRSLYKLGEKLSLSLKFIANLDVDCFKVNKDYFIIELNCRFGGQYPFSHLAGADFPKAILNMLKDEPVKKETLTSKVGTIGIKDIVPIKLKYEK